LRKVGKEFDLGIRPEYVKISKESGDIEGKVVVVERLGTAILYHVELLSNVMLTAKTYTFIEVKEGDKVYLTLPREKVRVFSKDGERVI